MAVLAPGVAQGLIQGLDASRQEAVRRQQLAAQKQLMDYQAWQIESARQAAARQAQARQNFALPAPPPQSQMPSAPAPQPPQPGQPSVPMAQPLQAIPPYQTVDRSGNLTGVIPGQAPGVTGFHGDPAVARQAIMSSSMPPQDKQLALRQLAAQSGGLMAPPPVASQQPALPTVTDPEQELVTAIRKAHPGITDAELSDVLADPRAQAWINNRYKVLGLQQTQTADRLKLMQEQRAIAYQQAEEARQAARDAEIARHNKVMEQQGAERVGQSAGGAADPSVLNNQIDLALTGMPKASIVAGWGAAASAQWNKVASGAVERLMQQNPGMSRSDAAAEFANLELRYRAQGVGKSAEARTAATTATNMRIASTEAKAMVSLAQQYSDAVNRTEYPNINAIENAVKKGTGDPNIVRLNTALNSLINSYARAINPRGAPTVSDKDHAREVVNAAYSKGQLSSILDVMGREMTIALGSAEGVNREYSGTGQPKAPKVGSIEDGYRFKGGDPASPSSWEKQ